MITKIRNLCLNYPIGQLADGIVKDGIVKEFAAFVSPESEIACNPVTSFRILHAAEPVTEKANLNETKRNRVRVFST